MSTSTFQHRPPAIRNLGERTFARGSGRASRFVTDRPPERDHNGIPYWNVPFLRPLH